MGLKKYDLIETLPNDVNLELKNKFKQIKAKKVSIDDFFSEFLNDFLSEETKKAYKNDLMSFFSFLKKGGENLSHPNQIESGHFQVYRDMLIKEHFASATINRKLVAIRSFMKWSVAKNLIEYNPLDSVKLPKVQTNSPTVAFDDHEVLEMLNAPDRNTKIGKTHRIAILLLFELGLRRSELAHIKLKDFYYDRGHFVLNIYGKGDKLRILPISKYLKKEIEQYIFELKSFSIDLEADDYLIQTNTKGKNKNAVNGSTIYRMVSKYSKQCGINKKLGPHSCRATAISHLLDTQKTPIRDVAIFAGHANITTTERYDKRRHNLDQSAAYNIDYHKKTRHE